MNLPSLERLIRDVGREYVLLAGDRDPVAVELRSATKGVPMNARHCCHAAEFALPAGLRFEPANYTLVAGDDTWPDLLMTPIGPDEDGRQLMQIVFHYPNSSDDRGPSARCLNTRNTALSAGALPKRAMYLAMKARYSIGASSVAARLESMARL